MAVKELAHDEAVRPRPPDSRPRAPEQGGPSLQTPMIERRAGLPPSNGLPSEVRAANFVGVSATAPDPVTRAKMALGLQQRIGNSGVAALIVSPPRPAVAVKNEAKVAPAPAAPAVVRPAPAQTAMPAEKPTPGVAAPAATPTPARTSAQAAPAAQPATAPPPSPGPAHHALAKTGKPSTAAEAEPERAEAPVMVAAKLMAAAAKPQLARGPVAGHRGAAAAEPTAGGPAAAASKKGGGRTDVVLKMKEPPADISPASHKRIAVAQSAASNAASAAASLPTASAHVNQARAAVTPPSAEASAKAEADLVATLGERPKPSPEVEELCKQIYAIIASKTPDDEPSLIKTDPEAMAREAGNQLKGDVEGYVKRVNQSYSPLDQKPPGEPLQAGTPIEPPSGATPTPPIDADQAKPDPVPAQDASLDADAADTKSKAEQAGMDTEPAKLVKTGPIAEAHDAQGELEQTAKEDPAKVMAQQQATLAKAGADMAALQKSALDALASSRRATLSSTGSQQHKMVGSEESMRLDASKQAQAIFTDAQNRVSALLQPLAQTAKEKWDAGVGVSSSKFKQELKKVEDWLKERHGGGWGAVVSVWDDIAGLPSWVTDKYTAAERTFGNEICDTARQISTEVNGVVMACEAIIADARTRINSVFSSLPANLQAWAAGQQAKFGAQLDGLVQHAHQVQTNFTHDLIKSATQSFQDVRDQLHALREKAKGLVGQVLDAIDRFKKDPAKFILEGLLELLHIPPAAFWAVVAKIQKAVKDIADDPMKFANNLMAAIGKGFTQFFDHVVDHLLHGFIDWLTGGLASMGIAIPKDFSLKSVITFILQLMGITWPRIRKLLAKHIGEENVALIEKVYSIVANLVALGPEGVFEMIKEKLNPATILNQIIKAAVDYMVKAVIKAVSARIILLFNPVGAILQALEAIYKVMRWIFTNAARIFRLVETVANGIADIVAGNLGGMANAVEMALASLIAPVIDFLADYLGFGDLPDKVKETIVGFQEMVEGVLDEVIGWLVEKGKALLSALGIGKDKQDKPKGNAAVAEKAVADLKAGEVSKGAFEEALKQKKEQAAELEPSYKDLLKDGTRLKFLFADPEEGKKKGEIDFTVEIAPNDTIATGTIPIPEEDLEIAKLEFAQRLFAAAELVALGIKQPDSDDKLAKWVKQNQLHVLQPRGSRDPCTTIPLYTFNAQKADRRYYGNRRNDYGYMNPNKESGIGLTILSKGLVNPPPPGQLFDITYHTTQALYRSMRSNRPPFPFKEAILGHDDSKEGASEHWNRIGHEQTKEMNKDWNDQSSNYWGPEHETESAASGSSSPFYRIPAKYFNSNEMWW